MKGYLLDNDVFVQIDKNLQVCDILYYSQAEDKPKGRSREFGHLLNTYKGRPITLCAEELKDIIYEAKKADN